jgi:hypothetical protein
MNDSERLEMTCLFLAAVQENLAERLDRYPDGPRSALMCSRAFASAVDAEAARGNVFAAKWTVLGAVDGRRCREFTDGLILASTVGIIGQWSNRPDRGYVLLSPRYVREILKAHPREKDAVRRFTAAYLEIVSRS